MKWHFGQVPVDPLDRTKGMRDRTNNELLDAFFNGTVNAWKDIVKRYERQAATDAAIAGVTDLPMT